MTEQEDMSLVHEGAQLANMLPYIQREMEKAEQALISRVLVSIPRGELTPERSLAAWLELAAIRGVTKRMKTKVAVGISAAGRQENTLAMRS